MSFFFSFEIINTVAPKPRTCFWISASITEAAAAIPNETKISFDKRTAAFLNDLLFYLIIN